MRNADQAARADRPVGTVTFLLTDVEGSTRLWEESPEPLRLALGARDRILRTVIEELGGYVFSTAGDSFSAAFWTPGDAVAAAVEAQRRLGAEQWPEPAEVRVRMGIETGTADEREGHYVGPAVNRAAHLMAAAHGGQIVVSQAAEELMRDRAPEGVTFVDLGEHELAGLARRERLFQVCGPGLALGFPPLRTLAHLAGNLPSAATSFVGHGEELRRLAADVPLRRLITLTGVGGVGKTRLALEAGGMVADKFPDGVWLCELAPVAEPAAVAHAVATTLSIRTQAGLSLVDSVVDALRGRRLLVILDNCEHLLDAAAELVGRVTESCPTVTVLATSREPLGVAGERVWVVPSLSAATEGVRLFCDRAEAAHASFSPSEGDLAVIAEICERLDGIPLAIELAAARVRFMTAADLAERLHDRFRLLRGGRRGLERHHTLAATVQWSYRLLPEAERVLFDRLSVFAGGFTLPAAEAVCADDRVDRLDVAGDLAALVDKSMVVADRAGNHARYRLLETLRQFGEERLDETAQAGELRDRHLRYYVGVAHEARRHYEGRAQAAGAATFRSEWANIRAAIQWAITQDDRATATGLLDALLPLRLSGGAVRARRLGQPSADRAARDADRVRHRRGVRRNARRLRPRAQPDRNGPRRGEITNRAGDMGVLDQRRGRPLVPRTPRGSVGRMENPAPDHRSCSGAVQSLRDRRLQHGHGCHRRRSRLGGGTPGPQPTARRTTRQPRVGRRRRLRHGRRCTSGRSLRISAATTTSGPSPLPSAAATSSCKASCRCPRRSWP